MTDVRLPSMQMIRDQIKLDLFGWRTLPQIAFLFHSCCASSLSFWVTAFFEAHLGRLSSAGYCISWICFLLALVEFVFRP